MPPTISKPPTSKSMPPTITKPPTSIIIDIIGAVIGSLIGIILLSYGGFVLYKWSKDKKENKKAITNPENGEIIDINS